MELLKREVSLAVLRVRLTDAPQDPAAGTSKARRMICCELEVTGKVEDRGLTRPSVPSPDPSSNRRSSSNRRPQTIESAEIESAAFSRVLAQWSFAPSELSLPQEYNAAIKFNDKPSFINSWLGNFTRWAVTTASKYSVLDHNTVDGLERFAAGVTWLPSGSPTLPQAMVRQLQTLLPGVLRDGDCLWLEIAEPVGYLPLLPWEEMLRVATNAPILRLSPHDVKSQSVQRGLTVALCVTAPSEAWTPTSARLRSMTQAILDSLPERSTLHIFPDDLCHARFRQAKIPQARPDSQGRSISIHEPPRDPPAPEKEESGDPWRAWIGTALRGIAVDIFHCIAPAMFFADNVWLAIARRPSPARPAKRGKKVIKGREMRYVTAAEVSELLTAFGAWGVIFTTPERGPWSVQARLGLRLLVDRIGRIRPVAAAFHDTALDADHKAISETYKFLIGDPSIKASTSAAISLYCHPSRALSVASEPASLPPELLTEYNKIKQAMEAMAARGEPMPGWMAATQRVVEQAISRASVTGAHGTSNEAAVRGVASALRYVDQMLTVRSTTQVRTVESPSAQKQGEAGG